MRLARKMASSARTVNQNQRNTLINNRPMGALAFGPLIGDGIVTDWIPPDLSLINGIQQDRTTHHPEGLLLTNPYGLLTYSVSAVPRTE
jgi:hypothetical protein